MPCWGFDQWLQGREGTILSTLEGCRGGLRCSYVLRAQKTASPPPSNSARTARIRQSPWDQPLGSFAFVPVSISRIHLLLHSPHTGLLFVPLNTPTEWHRVYSSLSPTRPLYLLFPLPQESLSLFPPSFLFKPRLSEKPCPIHRLKGQLPCEPHSFSYSA